MSDDVEHRETVALVGAPNVGKSVVFGALADSYVDVSNYPGTTVDTTQGECDDYRLTDTPGAHGISSFSEEERVTRDIVLNEADRVINVVDATQLDRDLFMTLQLLDMGIPTVVALNMMDEAAADGIEIDVEALEAELGVPVVPTVAVDGDGIGELRDRLPEASAPDETGIERFFSDLPAVEVGRARKTLLVEDDEPTARAVADADDGFDDPVGPDDAAADDAADQDGVAADGGVFASGQREAVYGNRRRRVGDVIDAVQHRGDRGRPLAERFSDLMIDPLTGTPIALAILGVIFYLIGVVVAQKVVDFLEIVVFGEYYNPAVEGVVTSVLPAANWVEPIEFLLVNDNLGLVTVTVQYILGVLLPLVIAFYLVIGVLEDSGMLPRLAVLTDRGLNRVGLNGRAIVPMIVGVGCVTMAVITTRMVGSRRERLISTALLGLAIPCSAQLGVIMGLLASLGMGWWVAYVGVLLGVLGVAGVVLDRTLPGESEALVTELPRMRIPKPRNVLRKTYNRTKMFLREAAPLFGVTAIGVSALDYAGGLDAIEAGLEPLTGLLGLPQEFGQILLLGLIRRDFAAAGMTGLELGPSQIFVGLVVITLFVPCILSMVMILKERDLKTGLVMWVGSWAVAFGVGAALAMGFAYVVPRVNAAVGGVIATFAGVIG
ncbi:ferrous iron transport protein B [Halococcoides cellulosivorans]|uniref:Ferrous iron transport protein B n=1 Tax=Halococcoides cellulosivorans TaxID=1679096 RepID=A0A2R4WZM3_9EURY|nr:ferrous iron transport protein B [Halococcoides cellulosivorans]AWB26955.1 ferrous iron transport protein B [Halococcoides cellulosivorans]